jgi:hypothetical protein
LLAQWQRAGACIIAVNTAVPACLAYGCVPDVACVAETDPSVAQHLEGLRGSGKLVALSSYASAEARDMAEQCGPVALAWKAEPDMYEWGLALGCAPLWFSDSVSVLAVAIARHLGARDIVLAGIDAAYTDDGRMYAKHTPFEDLHATVDERGLMRTLSTLERPSKVRAVAPALRGLNTLGGYSLTEPALCTQPESLRNAARGCTLSTVSRHALAIEGCELVELDAVKQPRRPTRYDSSRELRLKPLRDPQALLTRIRAELHALDPHREVYAPPNLPALWWGQERNQPMDTAQRIEGLRGSLADVRAAMLEACEP